MMNKKSAKRTLVMSALSLFLCIAMLAGTTFAWFTDSVSSKNNIIKAGNLDIELYWSVDAKDWHKVGERTNIFKEDTLWEPGHTEVVYLKVVNEGSLAMKYRLGINIVDETDGVNQDGRLFRLSDYIKFGVVETADVNYYGTREEALAAVDNFKLISAGYNESSVLYPITNAEGYATEEYATLVVTMPESVDDVANHNGINDPQIFLGLNVFATQLAYEEDSYGSDYDIGSPWAGEIDISWYNTADNAFVLTTPAQLAGLAEIVNSGTDNFSKKTVYLGADIDLNNLEWTPIGRFGTKATDTTYTFSGIFDGDGYTVSNLLITGRNSYVGLFGYTRSSKGEIKNLTVENATVSGSTRVGTVVGQAFDTKMTNVTVTGHVEINGTNYVGGVVGRGGASNDWIGITVDVDDTSYVKAISTEYDPGYDLYADENGYVHYNTFVGGVLGHMESGGRLRKDITTNIDVYGDNHFVGGAFGIVQYSDILENVTVTGDVIGVGVTTRTGGIAGGLQSSKNTYISFNNCSFSGSISNENGTLTDCDLYGGYYNNISNDMLIIVDGKDLDGNWAAVDVASLADALVQGGNVKLYKSLQSMHSTLTTPIEIPAGKTVTLDLNGKTAQGDWGQSMGAVIINNGTLTIKNGNLKNSRASGNNANGCSVILNKGTLTLQDVNITGSAWTTNQTSVYPGYAIENLGKLTVEEGTNISAGRGIRTEGAGAETVINGGTITLNNASCNVKASMHVHAIYADVDSTVTVNGGTFSMGTFTNKSEKNYPSCSGLLCEEDSATLTINGGTFNTDPTAYVAHGNAAFANSDGTYTVIPTVDDADELKAALAAGDDKIILGADINMNGEMLVIAANTAVTIDLNGYTFTSMDGGVGNNYAIKVDGGAVLTLNDSVGTGKVVSSCYGVAVQPGATFVMNGGALEVSGNGVYDMGVVVWNGTFVMNGGSINANGSVYTSNYYKNQGSTNVLCSVTIADGCVLESGAYADVEITDAPDTVLNVPTSVWVWDANANA